MNDLIDYGVSEAVAVMEFMAMAILLLGATLFVLVVWKLIEAGIERNNQRALVREAQSIFDRVRRENTPDLQIDPLLRSVFGQNIDLQPVGAEDSGEWLTKALFDVE